MLRVGVLKSMALAMVGLLLCACNPAPPTSAVELPSGFERLGRGVDDVVLRSADGARVRWGELNGAPRALFFGFTHCPDICPTTVQALGAAKARLGRRTDAIKIDFVTVDPERDTPEALTTYFDSLGVGVRSFAGDAESTKRIADAFRASYAKRPNENIGYTMDHTVSVYLLDREGRVVDQIPFGASQEVVDEKLLQLIQ